MAKVRAFIAVEIPPALKEKFRRISRVLQEEYPGVKWIKPDDIHLTLKFLGNVEIQQLADVQAALEAVSKRHAPLEGMVGGLGAFPGLSGARVIWAGIKIAGGGLSALVRDLETVLQSIGFKPERRRFKPHLTIGRVKETIVASNLKSALQRADAESIGRLKINMIVLMESTLTPRGPIYKVISEHRLGG